MTVYDLGWIRFEFYYIDPISYVLIGIVIFGFILWEIFIKGR